MSYCLFVFVSFLIYEFYEKRFTEKLSCRGVVNVSKAISKFLPMSRVNHKLLEMNSCWEVKSNHGIH